MRGHRSSERGQAAAELAALLPLLAVLIAGCWQVVLVAQASWSAAAAARSAARAAAIGADFAAAAREALPDSMERRLHVRVAGGGVDVRVRVPALVPQLSLGSVSAHAAFPSQT